MMRTITLMAAGLVLGFSSSQLFGQVKAELIQEAEVPAIVEGFQIGEMDFAGMVREMAGGITKEVKEKLALRMKQRGREKIALQIEFIDRVCKLNSKQRKMLGLVAKGVIQKSVNEIMAKIPARNKEIAKDAAAATKIQVAKDGDDDVIRVQNVERQAVMQGAAGQMFFAGGQEEEVLFLLEDLSNSGQVLNLQKHPLWKKQLNRILNTEQILVLKKAKAVRLEKGRHAAIAYTVSVFSGELLLSEKQQKQLYKIIDRRFGHVVERNLGNTIQYGNDLASVILSSGDKGFLEILSPVQKSIVKRKMRMLGGLGLPVQGIPVNEGGLDAVNRPESELRQLDQLDQESQKARRKEVKK